MARIAGIDLPRDKRIEIALTYIFGIGRKTAERIILDLKDKFKPAEALASESAAPADPESLKIRDAVLALVSLGYKRGEAESLIRKATADADVAALDVEAIIRKALAG